MKQKLALLVVCFHLAGAIHGAEGIAVTVRYQNSRDKRVRADLLQAVADVSVGLYRFDIRDNRRTRSRRICPYAAAYPALSPDGKRVVFYRCGIKVADDLKARREEDRVWRLSVINIDGTNLKDLVTFKGSNGYARLDWPLGDWIYYHKPHAKNRNGSGQIWRVNVNNPRQNELSWDLTCGSPETVPKLERWALDLSGVHMVCRTLGAPGWGANAAYLRYPPKQPGDGRATAKGRYSCDTQNNPGDGRRIRRCAISLSPSGNYICAFPSEGHGSIRIHNWDHRSNIVSFNRDIMGRDVLQVRA